jgi:hypothetical protein
VIVRQDALLDALNVQPAGLVTLSLPLPAFDPADCVFADRAVVQAAEYWNWFEARLVPVPPGPEAATRASYRTPALSGEIKGAKFTAETSRPTPPGGLAGLTWVNGENSL